MISTLFIIAVAIFVGFLALKWKTISDFITMSRKARIALQKVPGPHSYPLIGSVYQFKIDPQDFTMQMNEWLHKYCYDDEERMGLVKLWLGPYPLVLIEEPEYVKQILESNTLITKATQYDILGDWIGTGLLISTNEKWFTRRKMLTPAFHFNVLKGYGEVFVRQGEILIDQLEKFADTGREVDVFPFIKRCALDVICETAMGTQMNSQLGGNSEYVDAVTRISDIVFSYLRFPHLWFKPFWYASGLGFEFNKLAKLTNDFTRRVIRERRETLREEGILNEEINEEELKKKKLAFLDLLLMGQKTNELSDEDIREEVDTFMFEGHDTTASAIAFTIWFLGQYPEYQKKLHDELDEVFGDSEREGEEAEEGNMKRLVYLERCIKDSLRMSPSVPLIARKLSHDVTLGNTTLPQNMTVVISPMATHRNPFQYDHPNQFFPDHFTSHSISNRHPYSFFPFSAGPRNCIGQKFAMAEEKTILSLFFRRYRVVTSIPYPGNRPKTEVVLKPSEGIRVHLYKRKI